MDNIYIRRLQPKNRMIYTIQQNFFSFHTQPKEINTNLSSINHFLLKERTSCTFPSPLNPHKPTPSLKLLLVSALILPLPFPTTTTLNTFRPPSPLFGSRTTQLTPMPTSKIRQLSIALGLKFYIWRSFREKIKKLRGPQDFLSCQAKVVNRK